MLARVSTPSVHDQSLLEACGLVEKDTDKRSALSLEILKREGAGSGARSVLLPRLLDGNASFSRIISRDPDRQTRSCWDSLGPFEFSEPESTEAVEFERPQVCTGRWFPSAGSSSAAEENIMTISEAWRNHYLLPQPTLPPTVSISSIYRHVKSKVCSSMITRRHANKPTSFASQQDAGKSPHTSHVRCWCQSVGERMPADRTRE